MLPSAGVERDVMAAAVVGEGEDGDGEDGAEAFFSCHSFFFSLAQLPQELRYAPAFWPAALTDACA